jgi:nucleoside-diphosphate-sugar epimerase
MNYKQKVLVTGSTGFIGRALCEHLFDKGYSVVGSARNAGKMTGSHQYVFIETLDASTDWSEALQDCSVVIHLAGRAHILNEKHQNVHEIHRKNNTAATLNLAKQAAKLGVSRFIFLSTIGINGISTNGVAFNPKDITSPHSPYANSKLKAEIGLKSICQSSKMEAVVIRSPAVYGIGAPGNFGLIEKFIRYNIPLPFGSLKNYRSLISLENLVILLQICIEHQNAANQLFLVCDNEDISTPDIIRMMSKIIGKNPIIFKFPLKLLWIIFILMGKKRAGSSLILDLQVDNTLARENLGWKPMSQKDFIFSMTKKIKKGTK